MENETNLFFHGIFGAKGTSVILKTAIMETVKRTINGKEVEIKSQVDCTYGVLVIPNLSAAELQDLKLKSNQPMPGFKMSDKPVLNEDGTESGMFWVTHS